MKKILIMAGGTGGHVFPALAVATELQSQGVAVEWLGTQKGLESEIIPKTNIPIHYISIGSWRGKGVRKWLLAPFLVVGLLRALHQARKIIKTVNPDAVLGMGGFASGPGGLAAKLCRKPLIVHEQNSVPGLTNRVLAKLANQVLESFPNSFPKQVNAVMIGNPVRAEISNLSAPQIRLADRREPLRLLVLGGSQGALAINQVLPRALTIMEAKERPLVWHQTGKLNMDETRRNYQILNLPARVDAFIEDMAKAYDWADIVLCRAGALTLTELMAAGLGSILIPYPYAADNHQLRNAQYLVHARAAILLPQPQLSSIRLAELLRQFTTNRERLLNMADAARKLYRADAAQKVAQYCLAPLQEPVKNKDGFPLSPE